MVYPGCTRTRPSGQTPAFPGDGDRETRTPRTRPAARERPIERGGTLPACAGGTARL
jgi:hypothetical protein